MGCFGGLAALRTAQSLAQANQSYRILFVCTELCSLHVQKDDVRTDNLVAETIFGDGSAAAVVGCGLREGERPSFEIMKATCHALKDSKEKIRWDLSNTGYKVGLEPDIAFLLGQNIEGFCKALVNDEIAYEDAIWAIHPGGKAILELIEKKLGLTEEQMLSTWSTYQSYGSILTKRQIVLEILMQCCS
jgi:predicted naringenin-chalcone synthase